jgi:integrase
MAGNFLQRSRHGTTYFFRRRVPDDLVHIIKRRQIYKSLCTTCRRTAIILARNLAVRTDDLFRRLRMGKEEKNGVRFDWVAALDLGDMGTMRFETSPHDSIEDKERAVAAFKDVALAAIEARGASFSSVIEIDKEKAGKTLKEAVNEYLDGADLKPSSLKAYRLALEQYAIPFFGPDTPIVQIDQRQFAEFVTHIRGDGSKKDMTIVGYAYPVTALFKWQRSRVNGLPILTTATLLPKQKRPEVDERDAFSLRQLAIIIDNAKRYLGKEPSKYWVTVATALTGCRIEELAQVNLTTDLQYDSEADIWFLDINENPDSDGVLRKSLKRLSSWRVVPIHSALERAGFVSFLKAQTELGYVRPFESEWKPWRDKETGGLKWSHAISKWGGRELSMLDKIGTLKRDGLDLTYFHSMRHSFAHTLARQGVQEEERSALQGQQYGGINAGRYTKLRRDHKHLSGIVERHLGELALLL